MNKTKAIIIEDEKRAQIYLQGILALVAPEVEVLAICDDLPSGVMAIRKHKPDLVFLDIEMPKYSGLEIVNFFSLEEMTFSIIFTTAYNQYAIQAFKTSAIDYLLKPIEQDELKESLERFYKKRHTNHEKLHQVIDELKKQNKIAIPDGNSLLLVVPGDIVYLKADNSYTEVVMVSGEKYVASRFLKNFEESLKNYSNFFRCHKSYIINTDYMTSYNKSSGGTIVLNGKIEIPVSPDRVADLLSLFTKVSR